MNGSPALGLPRPLPRPRDAPLPRPLPFFGFGSCKLEVTGIWGQLWHLIMVDLCCPVPWPWEAGKMRYCHYGLRKGILAKLESSRLD